MRLLNLRTILVGSDLTSASDAPIRSAASLAAAADASLHVAHVIADDAHVFAQQGKRAEFELELNRSLERLGVGHTVSRHLPLGAPAAELASLADRLRADVIVTGRHRNDAVPVERPLGGTAWAVVTQSLMPCLALVKPLSAPLQRVVVGIDCSRASRGAMLVALSWLSALRNRSGPAPVLTVLHVHSETATPSAGVTRAVNHEVEILRRLAGTWAGVDVSPLLVHGEQAVPELARVTAETKADLVVVGTRGLGETREGTLGSVSAGLLREVTAPVLLVPPAVWMNHAKELDYF